jgi:peptidoglycan-binding protein ArfA
MTGSDDERVSATATEWRTKSRFYRSSPGWGWLLGLLLIPLLFGWLGWGALKPEVNISAPSISTTAPGVSLPALNFAPVSILRNGNDFTLSGILPDLSVKNSLLDSMKAALGSDVNLIDKIEIKSAVSAPDLAEVGGLLKAADAIPDFGFTIEGPTLTLAGTAPSDEVRAAVEDAAKAAWPNAQIVNNIDVKAAATGSCDNLQADITSAMNAPVHFGTANATLAPSSSAMLSAVANAIKGCPDARVTVTGYTDNTASDATNIPLSERRAKAVGDYLVSQGVSAQAVTTKGLGASSPVASNDTAAGRAQNRRVEITVS